MPSFRAAMGLGTLTGVPCQSTSPSSGWCAPESTLIRVDLPAPFCPSTQWTSPARTSRSMPSSARTPGNSLTMPRICSSGASMRPPRGGGGPPPTWRPGAVRDLGSGGDSGGAEDGVGDEPRGADDAGGVAQFGQDDGQVAGRQRQRPAVDDAADLGQQRVAEPGDAAADDDEAGVEEADEGGERETEPASAAPDEGDRRGVPGPGGRADVDGAERAGQREPLGEDGRATGAGGELRVAGERGAAEERLQAAVVAAGAGGPRVLDADVADVAGGAVRAAVHLALQHDAAPDARADLDEEEVVDAPRGAGVLLAERHDVDVVVDHDRCTDGSGQGVPDGEPVPARHDRGHHRGALARARGAGAPAPTPWPSNAPPSARSLSSRSSACWSTTFGPWRTSDGSLTCDRSRSSPSVTATSIEVAPMSMPTKRMCPARPTRWERRPPREAASPCPATSPSS